MAAYNILEARNNLSRLVAMAESGAEVTIMRRGKPVAKIVAASEREAPSTGAQLAAWFAANPIQPGGRTTEEIEEGIRELREAGA